MGELAQTPQEVDETEVSFGVVLFERLDVCKGNKNM